MQSATDKLNGFLLRLIRVGVIVALFTPFLRKIGNLNPVFIKGAAFQVIVEVIFAAWVVLAISDRRYRPNWRHPVVIGVLVFLAALLVTLPFSAHPWMSFWSIRGRMTGVVNYLHFGAWFLVLASVFKDAVVWRRLLAASNLVCLAIDGIGIILFFTSPGQNERLIGTLDNPAFFAAYALPHVFIALALAARTAPGWWRRFYLFAAASHLLAIVMSASRGALVALAVALIVGAVLYGFKIGSKRRRFAVILTAIGIVALIVGSLIYVRFNPGSYWSGIRLPRFVNRVIYADFGSDRLSLWRIAALSFGERPVFGWGLEVFRYAFDRHFDPGGLDAVLTEKWYDRTHNQYLDTLVATGLVGFLTYLFLVYAALREAFLTFRRSEKTTSARENGVWLLLFVAVFVQLFFSFDTVAALMVLMLCLARLAALSRPAAPVVAAAPRQVRWPVVAGIATLVVLAAWYVNFLPFAQGLKNEKGYFALLTDRPLASRLLMESLRTRTAFSQEMSERLIDGLGYMMEKVSEPYPELRELTLFAADYAGRTAHALPPFFETQLVAAVANNFAGLYEPDRLELAEVYARRALADAPARLQAYDVMTGIALAKRDWPAAQGWARQAMARAQGESARIRFLDDIALAQFGLGDYGAAMKSLAEAQVQGYAVAEDGRLALPLAEAVPAGGDARATELIGQMVEKNPSNPEVLRAYAVIHAKAGETGPARRALNILELYGHPEWVSDLRERFGL